MCCKCGGSIIEYLLSNDIDFNILPENDEELKKELPFLPSNFELVIILIKNCDK